MMLITYCKFLYLGICMCLVTTGYHGIDNLVTTGYHCIDNLVKQRCCLCLNLYYIFMFTLTILRCNIPLLIFFQYVFKNTTIRFLDT